jgi:hypothetical protein
VSICTLLLTNSTDFILSTLGFTYWNEAKIEKLLIFTSCKHGKAQVWVMTDIHSLIVIYGRSLLR